MFAAGESPQYLAQAANSLYAANGAAPENSPPIQMRPLIREYQRLGWHVLAAITALSTTVNRASLDWEQLTERHLRTIFKSPPSTHQINFRPKQRTACRINICHFSNRATQYLPNILICIQPAHTLPAKFQEIYFPNPLIKKHFPKHWCMPSP